MTTTDLEKAILDRTKNLPIRSLRTTQLRPNHECDVLTISRSGFATEYEIKRTRSDFFADFKKPKHIQMRRGNGGQLSRFYFVCPQDLISIDDIPKYAGLIYVTKKYGRLQSIEIRKAPKLKASKLKVEDEVRVYRSIMFRWLKDQMDKK
jgi:hypothetical protein